MDINDQDHIVTRLWLYVIDQRNVVAIGVSVFTQDTRSRGVGGSNP
jgi:hypothetical protein